MKALPLLPTLFYFEPVTIFFQSHLNYDLSSPKAQHHQYHRPCHYHVRYHHQDYESRQYSGRPRGGGGGGITTGPSYLLEECALRIIVIIMIIITITTIIIIIIIITIAVVAAPPHELARERGQLVRRQPVMIETEAH
jgi:hypothetical protein